MPKISEKDIPEMSKKPEISKNPEMSKKKKSIIRNPAGINRTFGKKKKSSMSQKTRNISFSKGTHAGNTTKPLRQGNRTFLAEQLQRRSKERLKLRRKQVRKYESRYPWKGYRVDKNYHGLLPGQSAALQGRYSRSGSRYSDQALFTGSVDERKTDGTGKKKKKQKKSKKAKKKQKSKKKQKKQKKKKQTKKAKKRKNKY